MTTSVIFYEDPLNIDYLMHDVRIQFGDLTGDIFTDTIIRSAIVSAFRYLQNKWDGKYQIFSTDAIISPQPEDIRAGYIRIASLHGYADVPTTLVDGDIFRDPYIVFQSDATKLIESIDEQAVILAAVVILRRAQISSSAGEFLAWGTEDIRYNNLGAERSLTKLLEYDISTLNAYIQSRIAKPRRSNFPITYIPIISVL